MTELIHLPQVGAQDPELKNSFITDEGDDEAIVIKQEVPGDPVCYFNAQAFKNGQYVCSGSTRLRCNFGIWVRDGSCDPDHP